MICPSGISAKLAVSRLPFWHNGEFKSWDQPDGYIQIARKFSGHWATTGVGIGFANTVCLEMEGILNKRILIVDDDERLLRALARTLSSEGAVVTTTQGAGDAIEILFRREKSVDLVITDLRMPLVTGVALVHFVRLLLPNLPVIVLTAYGSPETRADCLQQGAAAFLEKNLSTVQLLTEIKQIFMSRKMATDPSGTNDAWKGEAIDE